MHARRTLRRGAPVLALAVLLAACAGRPAPPAPVRAATAPDAASATAAAPEPAAGRRCAAERTPRAAAGGVPAGGWRSARLRDHPLVGTIVDTRSGCAIGWHVLVRQLHAARYVLLGETHDNPDHHRLQARLVRALAADRYAVVFEMLDRDHAGRAAAALRTPGSPAERARALSEAVDWAQSGWPGFALYAPVFEAALRAGLAVRAAGLPRRVLAPLWNGAAAAAIDAQLARRFELARPLPERIERDWLDALDAAHCHALERARLRPMITAQRLRDAALAQALLEVPRALLIAGAGHVRRDRGVPSLLVREGVSPDAIGALAFVEVEPGWRTPADAVDPAFDAIWVTPRAERDDPCAALVRTHGSP